MPPKYADNRPPLDLKPQGRFFDTGENFVWMGLHQSVRPILAGLYELLVRRLGSLRILFAMKPCLPGPRSR